MNENKKDSYTGFTQLVESLKQQQHHYRVPFSSRSGALDHITHVFISGWIVLSCHDVQVPSSSEDFSCWLKDCVIRSKASEQLFKRALWWNFNCRYFPLVTNWPWCVASSLCALILLVLALASILRYLFFCYHCIRCVILMLSVLPFSYSAGNTNTVCLHLMQHSQSHTFLCEHASTKFSMILSSPHSHSLLSS